MWITVCVCCDVSDAAALIVANCVKLKCCYWLHTKVEMEKQQSGNGPSSRCVCVWATAVLSVSLWLIHKGKRGLGTLAEGNTSVRERTVFEADVESNKTIVLYLSTILKYWYFTWVFPLWDSILLPYNISEGDVLPLISIFHSWLSFTLQILHVHCFCIKSLTFFWMRATCCSWFCTF